MSNPKNIFDKIFLLDPDKHPPKTILVREVTGHYGSKFLAESTIEEYTPNGSAVLLSNRFDLSESSFSKLWIRVEHASATVIDVLDRNPKKPDEEAGSLPAPSGLIGDTQNDQYSHDSAIHHIPPSTKVKFSPLDPSKEDP